MEQLTFAQQIQQFVANHTIMVAGWVALFIAVMFSLYKGATSKIKVVSNTEATLLINKQDGIVIDVRSDEEFKVGHIIDSQHLLPSDIKGNKLNTLEKYKTRPVIIADNNGLTAQNLANLLAKQGFQAYALKDGIAGWRGANLPLVRKHK